MGRYSGKVGFEQENSLQGKQGFAQFLQASPARSILDQFCKSIAEETGCQCATIALREAGTIGLIASHGLPITIYERFRRSGFRPSQSRLDEFETSDIQKDERFKTSSYVLQQPGWKYAAMHLITHNHAAQYDLEIWCADGRSLPVDKGTLPILRRIAPWIASSITLMMDLHHAANEVAERDSLRLRVLLASGMTHLSFPAALIDENLTLIEATPAFKSLHAQLGGSPFAYGESLAELWFDEEKMVAASQVFAGERRLFNLNCVLGEASTQLKVDFSTTQFEGIEQKFGFLAVSSQAPMPVSNKLNDVAVDQRNDLGDKVGPVTKFLQSTIVRKNRVLSRKSHFYLAACGWRPAIKSYQIEALRALKEDMSAGFLDAAADDLVTAISRVYGTQISATIVPMPCGHSGAGCFSSKLAKAVAEKMKLPWVDAFACQAMNGSSHPRQNARRPKMKLVSPVKGQVILVDDVATSGAHIEEARTALLGSASSVWPVVWIAG